MFVGLVRIVLFLQFRKHGIFDILNSILPETRKEFFKSHKIWIITQNGRNEIPIEMSRYYRNYKQRVSLLKKIQIVAGNNFGYCVSKYITFLLSHIRYQQVRQCSHGATLQAPSCNNWHYTNIDLFLIKKGKRRKQIFLTQVKNVNMLAKENNIICNKTVKNICSLSC